MFLIDRAGHLVEMTQQLYESEDLLQSLIALHPSLLAGDQMMLNEEPRWLLVRREAGVPAEEDGPGRWSVDHLFLDHLGVPTLVEVKRSTDTRLRRAVVGQMLDYAAHAVVNWTAAGLRQEHYHACTAAGISADEALQELIGPDGDVDEFWTQVARNLEAGRVRMVFVADVIPREVRQVVEFLNTQMTPAEVLAVEVKQFVDPEAHFRTLVPQVVGQTVRAQAKKSGGSALGPKPVWDRTMVLASIEDAAGTEATERAVAIIDQMTERGWEHTFHGGHHKGAMCFMLPGAAQPIPFVFVHSTGRLGFAFDRIMTVPPFNQLELRAELAKRLEVMPGLQVPNLDGGPRIALTTIGVEAIDTLGAVIDWIRAKIAAA